MAVITNLYGLEILDSRGNPTVEAVVETEKGTIARASVPSGASTGSHEAVELRDKDKSRYLGKGVLNAVKNINEIISDEIIGNDVRDQRQIDFQMIEMDGTENKSKLGANATLAVSLAVAKAAAIESKLPLYKYLGGVGACYLPIPMMNIINGGSHADNGIDFQEFMIFPSNAPSFSESLRMGVEIFHNLKSLLHSKKLSTNVGDEGGFAPNISSNEDALKYVIEAIEKAGFVPGKDVYIALDAASSEFYDIKTKTYTFHKSKSGAMSSDELVNLWKTWCEKYPIISIEDGLHEDDWDGWVNLTKTLGHKVQLVGDDLFVTNTKRLSMGIEKNVANSILVKVNQIGTLTETIETVNLAKESGYTSIMSHRSGETEDTTIADLAVALGTNQIKTGSASRTDRIAKYNQLLRIEFELENTANFIGNNFKFCK